MAKIGVLGSGSFGVAISQLLAYNTDVLLYCRRQEVADQINNNHSINDNELSERIVATNDLSHIGDECSIIFPVLPSEYFRDMIKKLAPNVGPGHILIHGTKGLDTSAKYDTSETISEIKKSVFTMSEVIRQETSVIRTGCLAGPNLAKEILSGQPAATVIASEFDEVIIDGKEVLASERFIVYGSYNLKGIELAGALKNVIAIASGIMNGFGFGKNMEALLITRGLREMIHIAKSVGSEVKPFLGTAGIGDLIATATSSKSRNYTFGYKISQGQTVDDIKQQMNEVAEGYRTVKFAKKIIDASKIEAPLTTMLHKVLYENTPVDIAMKDIINNPLSVDVDFL